LLGKERDMIGRVQTKPAGMKMGRGHLRGDPCLNNPPTLGRRSQRIREISPFWACTDTNSHLEGADQEGKRGQTKDIVHLSP